jgi:hypothetical protein
MTFGATDIPVRDVASLRKGLSVLEAELVTAKGRRDKILIERQKAIAAVDTGDQRARFAQAALNKEDGAAGRLILSLEAQVADARKRLAMAETQAATVEAKSHAMAIPCDGAGKWRWFETTTLDGRVLRHRALSLAELQKALLKNYKVTAEVFGASATGVGGVASQIGSDVPSIMAGLLAAHGEEIVAFLAERGIKSTAAS